LKLVKTVQPPTLQKPIKRTQPPLQTTGQAPGLRYLLQYRPFKPRISPHTVCQQDTHQWLYHIPRWLDRRQWCSHSSRIVSSASKTVAKCWSIGYGNRLIQLEDFRGYTENDGQPRPPYQHLAMTLSYPSDLPALLSATLFPISHTNLSRNCQDGYICHRLIRLRPLRP
jgi:hypothetical protein